MIRAVDMTYHLQFSRSSHVPQGHLEVCSSSQSKCDNKEEQGEEEADVCAE